MMRTLNILLAEDNADDVFFMRQAFKRSGVTSHLQSVCDGLEAKAYLLGESAFADRNAYPFPDILLLDLNMPRMNGFEVLEWLRTEPDYAGLPVYVLTASCREEDIRRAYQLHANTYVVKPARLDELADFIRTLHEWHRFVCLPTPRPEPADHPLHH